MGETIDYDYDYEYDYESHTHTPTHPHIHTTFSSLAPRQLVEIRLSVLSGDHLRLGGDLLRDGFAGQDVVGGFHGFLAEPGILKGGRHFAVEDRLDHLFLNA